MRESGKPDSFCQCIFFVCHVHKWCKPVHCVTSFICSFAFYHNSIACKRQFHKFDNQKIGQVAVCMCSLVVFLWQKRIKECHFPSKTGNLQHKCRVVELDYGKSM